MAGGYDIGASFSGSSSATAGVSAPFTITTGGASKTQSSNLAAVLILGGVVLAGIALVWFLFKK